MIWTCSKPVGFNKPPSNFALYNCLHLKIHLNPDHDVRLKSKPVQTKSHQANLFSSWTLVAKVLWSILISWGIRACYQISAAGLGSALLLSILICHCVLHFKQKQHLHSDTLHHYSLRSWIISHHSMLKHLINSLIHSILTHLKCVRYNSDSATWRHSSNMHLDIWWWQMNFSASFPVNSSL